MYEQFTLALSELFEAGAQWASLLAEKQAKVQAATAATNAEAAAKNVFEVKRAAFAALVSAFNPSNPVGPPDTVSPIDPAPPIAEASFLVPKIGPAEILKIVRCVAECRAKSAA